MKRISSKLLSLLLTACVTMFVACKDDDKDDKKSDGQTPVYGENFTVTVDGNDVTLTTTMSADYMWVEVNGKTVNFDGATATLNIPLEGDYDAIVRAMFGSETFSSETFVINISSSDLSYLEGSFWKALTGGKAGYNKTWRLDDFVNSRDMHYTKYHQGTLGYVDPSKGEQNGSLKIGSLWGSMAGTHEEDPNGNWVGEDWTNGVSLDDYAEDGTITFDGATMTAKLVMTKGIKGAGASAEWWEATVEQGFSIELFDTAAMLSEIGVNLSSITAVASGNYSSQFAKITFNPGIRFPFTYCTMLDERFKESSIQNSLVILSCTDSSMIVFGWRDKEWSNICDPTSWGQEKTNNTWGH
mgnify:CR=1 FL=1